MLAAIGWLLGAHRSLGRVITVGRGRLARCQAAAELAVSAPMLPATGQDAASPLDSAPSPGSQNKVWTERTIPSSWKWDRCDARRTPTRQSTCELELDGCAHDILNRKEASDVWARGSTAALEGRQQHLDCVFGAPRATVRVERPFAVAHGPAFLRTVTAPCARAVGQGAAQGGVRLVSNGGVAGAHVGRGAGEVRGWHTPVPAHPPPVSRRRGALRSGRERQECLPGCRPAAPGCEQGAGGPSLPCHAGVCPPGTGAGHSQPAGKHGGPDGIPGRGGRCAAGGSRARACLRGRARQWDEPREGSGAGRRCHVHGAPAQRCCAPCT